MLKAQTGCSSPYFSTDRVVQSSSRTIDPGFHRRDERQQTGLTDKYVCRSVGFLDKSKTITVVVQQVSSHGAFLLPPVAYVTRAQPDGAAAHTSTPQCFKQATV